MKIFVEVTMEEAREDYNDYVECARECCDKEEDIYTFEEYINSGYFRDNVLERAYTDAIDYMQDDDCLRIVD
jgi:hypothetical protein